MNKKLLATAVATMLALSTGIAMASPEDGVKLDGSVSLQYRHDSGDEHQGTSYIGKFLLNANMNLDNHFDLYARLAAEGLSQANSSGRDYIGYSDPDKKSYAGIDLFGFKYQNAGVNYVVGRQTGSIGATGTLYNTEGYMGKDVFLDGVTVTTKSGITDLKLVVAENKYDSESNKLYALSGSYNPSKDVTLGATFAKYNADANTNYWAVNAGYNLGKASFAGEYAKSNASDQNKAYNISANYAFDAKNSVYVIAHRTEVNGNITDLTNFDSGEKGFYYGYDYKVDKDSTVSLFYKDNKVIGTDGSNKSFRTTYSVKF